MIDTVLLKVASRCNLNCSYCYVYNLGDEGWKRNPRLMSRKTIDAITDNFRKLYAYQQKGFAVTLHGGEPFLMRPYQLEYLFQSMRSVLPEKAPVSIQTNGLLLTETLIELCAKYRVTISISLDGPEAVHDEARVDHLNRGSFKRVEEKILLIQNHKQGKNLFTGCLAVVNPTSNPKEIYRYFKNLGVPSVNFLMRDGNHDRYPQGKASFESVEFGRWLAQLWWEYFNDPRPIPIAIFDNYVKLLLGGTSTKEGSGTELSGILIIDTNGDITKNDTLKSTQNGNDLFADAWNVNTHDITQLIQTEDFHKYMQLQTPTAEKCQKCQLLSICGGGMPLYRWSLANQFNNPSVYCADHSFLITAIQNTLEDFYETAK